MAAYSHTIKRPAASPHKLIAMICLTDITPVLPSPAMTSSHCLLKMAPLSTPSKRSITIPATIPPRITRPKLIFPIGHTLLSRFRNRERRVCPMGKINLGRVILGGIVAGIVIDLFEGVLNGAILSKQWEEVMAGLGKTGVMSVKQIIAFNLWGLAAGLLMVWLYAAIRPRYGAGPRTAACAGIAVWALAYLLGSGVSGIMHLFPVGLTLVGIGVGLIETIVAGVAGAAVYKEDEGMAAKPAMAA